jgi:hypothetical protein
MRIRTIVVVTLVALLTGAALAQDRATTDLAESSFSYEDRQIEERALTNVRGADSALVVAWNKTVNDIAFAEDQFLTFKGVRAHAMMHLAMHDALNAIIPLYRQYAFNARDPLADPIAAAAQAAHDVVVSQYPGEQTKLDAELERWLGHIPAGHRKDRGTALGGRCAAAILAARAQDGWDFQGTYNFSNELGKYQTTPPWDGLVLQPGFRFAKPFGIHDSAQFRPDPPPNLASPEYAAAYNEVKDFGRADSQVRTPDQTGYAVWWMEFTEGSMNRLARELVGSQQAHLWRAARLFALLNMSMFDAYLANWDSKYEYNHWRPYTAVRNAARDGNPATKPDSGWEPLRTTPPFPEYASAHAAVCSASFEVLKQTVGDDVSFTMTTTTAPPEMPTRSFPSFSAAAAECADSRVRVGFHFRYSTDQGLVLGREVARWIIEKHLQFRWAIRQEQ